ncbi:MAG TPA: glycosyltransferase family 39 protein [Acidimicrobiales bacterium]|nr:glycosyltransferase family 39 protein [Acidimicrobiales bacterium]
MSIGTVTDPPVADDEVPTVVRYGNRLALIRTVLVLAAGLGLALRLWYMFHDALNSDEASVGLAAQHILNGHFNAFYPGQLYGGVEPYLTAALFGVFGQSALMVKLTPALLSAVAAVLMWRIARRLLGDGQIAALAGVLFWVAPVAALWNSTVERGFRGVTMACGLGALLFALRCLDGRRRYIDLVALGLFLGVGWWSSPEIAYFVVPVGLLLIGAVVVSPSGRRIVVWVPRFIVALAAAGVGALPWLWVNIPAFRSLQASSFPGGQAKVHNGYSERLQTFFNHVLPMQTNLVVPGPATEVFRHNQPLQLVFQFGVDAIIVVAVVLCAAKGGRGLAIVAGAVALPFIFALQPGTWFWEDGRYGVFVGALLVPVLAIACDQVPVLARRFSQGHRHRQSRAPASGRYLMVAVVVVSSVFSVMSFSQVVAGNGSFFSNWGDPNAPTLAAIDRLEAGGVRTGYAEYWLAYDLDFLSKERLAITTVPGADTNRSKSLNRVVEHSRQPAWLFVPQDRLEQGYLLFADTEAIVGPASMPEAAFTAKLKALGIPYRIVDAGVIRAVIPSRSVTPKQVGLP